MHPLLQKVETLRKLVTINKNNNKVEKDLTEQVNKEIESDFEAFSRQTYGVTVACYDDWLNMSRVVRKGEKERKINGYNVFHITQTQSRFG